jgi:exonuclease SbcD
MRILHTADWHLGDRLGCVDRTDDLRRAVEQIAAYCESERVDILLVAGDLFSELARPDGLRDAVRHLQETFAKFLRDGGTIVAVTGNHDNENFCQTLWHAMGLASPASASNGKPASRGRLHLATGPTLLRLPDRRGGFEAQFALMPFPTPARFLADQPAQKYASLDEKNRHLSAAFARKLRGLLDDPHFVREAPSVLAAHITVGGGEPAPLFRLSPQEDIVLPLDQLPPVFAYAALGHIHRPKMIDNHKNIRYCGSIERLDLGEMNDAKGVVVFDLGPDGIRDEPAVLPLQATPIYEVEIVSPKDQLPTLAERFPDAQRDLVNLHITYTAGEDNLEEILRELDQVFPRWYSREWRESGALGAALTVGEAGSGKSFEDTVREYLKDELTNHDEAERVAILQRAEQLLSEMGA